MINNKHYYINLQAYNLSVCFQGYQISHTFKDLLKEENPFPFFEKTTPIPNGDGTALRKCPTTFLLLSVESSKSPRGKD